MKVLRQLLSVLRKLDFITSQIFGLITWAVNYWVIRHPYSAVKIYDFYYLSLRFDSKCCTFAAFLVTHLVVEYNCFIKVVVLSTTKAFRPLCLGHFKVSCRTYGSYSCVLWFGLKCLSAVVTDHIMLWSFLYNLVYVCGPMNVGTT